MRLGIFAKTFVRPTLEETLDAVKAHGLDCVQFNMSCAGLPTLPERIDAELCDRIRMALADRHITMAAVSGTFNMIHPDRQERRDGMRRLQVLAQACPRMGTRIITLCTGTRDPDNMWRWHPDNDTPAAWQDLMDIVYEALDIAEKADVILAVEPERANVVDSNVKAFRLLAEMVSTRLKIVIDPANLFRWADVPYMHEILDEIFCPIMGTEIALAHAKDFTQGGEGDEVKYVAAGRGVLDYDYYLACLNKVNFFDAPLILHGLEEAEVDDCLAFLRNKTARLPPPYQDYR